MFATFMVSSADQAVADMTNVSKGMTLNINSVPLVSYPKRQENAERVNGK